jgi:hypothetical protein
MLGEEKDAVDLQRLGCPIFQMKKEIQPIGTEGRPGAKSSRRVQGIRGKPLREPPQRRSSEFSDQRVDERANESADCRHQQRFRIDHLMSVRSGGAKKDWAGLEWAPCF